MVCTTALTLMALDDGLGYRQKSTKGEIYSVKHKRERQKRRTTNMAAVEQKELSFSASFTTSCSEAYVQSEHGRKRNGGPSRKEMSFARFHVIEMYGYPTRTPCAYASCSYARACDLIIKASLRHTSAQPNAVDWPPSASNHATRAKHDICWSGSN